MYFSMLLVLIDMFNRTSLNRMNGDGVTKQAPNWSRPIHQYHT
jgi:hypothetical protein